MEKKIVFPIIKFMDNDNYLASVDSVFFGDKSLIYNASKFNSNFTIVDSVGQVFNIKKLIPQKFSLLLSIKHFGNMYKLDPEFEYVTEMPLDELKNRVWNHVKLHKSFWSPIDDGRGLKRMIMGAKDFKELILMFR